MKWIVYMFKPVYHINDYSLFPICCVSHGSLYKFRNEMDSNRIKETDLYINHNNHKNFFPKTTGASCLYICIILSMSLIFFNNFYKTFKWINHYKPKGWTNYFSFAIWDAIWSDNYADWLQKTYVKIYMYLGYTGHRNGTVTVDLAYYKEWRKVNLGWTRSNPG